MRRNVLNSPRLSELKRRRRRIILNKFLISLLGLAVVFGLLTYVSRIKSLNISEIEISGNKVLDTEVLRNAVQEQLTGKYLWLFPKTNLFIYPSGSIKNALQNKFKRLESINLSIKSNKTLVITVSERTAEYTWCGNIPRQQNDLSKEQCYFMDNSGYIFDEAPYFSGDVYFKFYGDTSINTESPLGSPYLKDNFLKLVAFKQTLSSMGLKPVSLYTIPGGDINIFLSSSSSIQPEIIINIDSDLQNIASNLQAALSTDPLLTKFKKHYSQLEYIDLRFGNKVYYKFGGPASSIN